MVKRQNSACDLVAVNPGDDGVASPQRRRARLFLFPPPCLRLWQRLEPLELTLLGCSTSDAEAKAVRGVNIRADTSGHIWLRVILGQPRVYCCSTYCLGTHVATLSRVE